MFLSNTTPSSFPNNDYAFTLSREDCWCLFNKAAAERSIPTRAKGPTFSVLRWKSFWSETGQKVVCLYRPVRLLPTWPKGRFISYCLFLHMLPSGFFTMKQQHETFWLDILRKQFVLTTRRHAGLRSLWVGKGSYLLSSLKCEQIIIHHWSGWENIINPQPRRGWNGQTNERLYRCFGSFARFWR